MILSQTHHKICLMISWVVFLSPFSLSSLSAAPTPLISAGTTWTYLDNGSNQGDAWKGTGFIPSSEWKTGPAQLGYGDGDESTVLSFGPDANAKFITTYFRKKFNVSNPSAFTSLKLRLLRDDGAAIYLNGVEVYRNNMPTGTVGYSTLAVSALGTPDEATFIETSLAPNNLVSGENTIAVEIHQANGTSSDVSFDLELIGIDTVSVTRGPYLQSASPTSVKMRWRTDAPTDSLVSYGTTQNSLNLQGSDTALTTEHEVTLNYLSSGTQYFYSIGSTSAVLKTGPEYYFYTAPTANQNKAVRLWVLGDSGTADSNARAVRDAYLSYNGTQYTDLLLMLGDNAYNTGTDTEYQAAVFDMYPTVLKNTSLWPTIGNHDTAQSATVSETLPYFKMFSLPTNGESGGVSSGTEKYYSFNYANIHFICLDSMTSSRATNGAMLTWLQSDLAANTLPWTIAFWHHPPYTKGSHNSDTETNLIEMRQNALPILEQYGVDLVLSGHSHSYERSYFIDNHYGLSSTFTQSMKKNSGSGRTDGTGAYRKASLSGGSHNGAVYAVAGSSGQISGGLLNHPAMYISLNQLGSMVIDVDGQRLDAKFLNNSGSVTDYFTLIKGATNQPPSVTLNAPQSGSPSIAIPISATASDTDGTISKVEFYSGTQLIATDYTAPYETTWSTPNTGTYALKAIATDNETSTSTSNVIDFTVSSNNSGIPTAPSSLNAIALSKTKISLNWTDNSSNESGFKIQRSANNQTSWTDIATVAANLTSYVNSGLKSKTLYYYRICSYNSYGCSSYSTSPAATTK